MVHRLLRPLQRAVFSLAVASLLGWCAGVGWAAEPAALAELLRRADELDARQEVAAALKCLLEVEAKFPNQAEVLFRLAKQQSNQIFDAPSQAEKNRLAALCLATAERAVAADPQHARARLSVGICLAKNFPHVDNQTKVNYSRRLKEETEKAIALEPKLDLAYHMLAGGTLKWRR